LLGVLDTYIIHTQYRKKLVYVYALGILCQIIGTIIWYLDNEYCNQLDGIRQNLLPAYLSPITQLHGWWHVFAGYATYYHILFCMCQRQVYLRRGCELIPTHIVGYTVQWNKAHDENGCSIHDHQN
jgi:hypothetical protein